MQIKRGLTPGGKSIPAADRKPPRCSLAAAVPYNCFERRSAGAFPQSRWNRGILFAVLELLFRAVFLFSAAELKNGLHGSSEHNAADFAYNINV